MTAEEAAAYDAPFPDASYRAATRAFPERVPERVDDDGAEVARRAARFWTEDWNGVAMMAGGVQDPVCTPEAMEALRTRIRGCPPAMRIEPGGHFVPEHGEMIAAEALARLA